LTATIILFGLATISPCQETEGGTEEHDSKIGVLAIYFQNLIFFKKILFFLHFI